jgi:predicted dehydrogenase
VSGTAGYAIIGAGEISGQHAEAIALTPQARLVAICSGTERSARTSGERWGVPWSTDLNDTLARSDVDVAVICTPSGMHAQQAAQALDAGKHVLIEKPLALSLADADRVIAMGHARGLLVSVISQRRFEPIVQQIRQALTDQALGPIALVEACTRYYRPQAYYEGASWRGTKALDGGALMNQGIHMVDLVRWLMGPISQVSGFVGTLGHRMESEDTATASVLFSAGALGTLAATTCAYPGFTQDLWILGDRGHLHLVDRQLVAWSVADALHSELLSALTSNGAGGAPDGQTQNGHVAQYLDMTRAVLEGRSPAVTGEDGRSALEVVLAVYESAQQGRVVALPANGMAS